MSKQRMFRVIFISQDKIYEIYANKLYESELLGFIEVEDFVFGETTALVVDPSVEKLKAEFDGVTRSYIPMQSVLRIDELDTASAISRVKSAKTAEYTNVSTLPGVNLAELEKNKD